MAATLIALPYSPWSEKARWALDHHGRTYREITYVPMLGEPVLRVATGTWRGKVTVPTLLTPHGPIRDSLRIARHAERSGNGSPLFPDALIPEIERWNEVSERMLAAARVLVLDRTIHDPAAQAEALPAAIPDALRGPLRSMAVMGSKFVARKYGADAMALDEARSEIARALDTLRAALPGNAKYLLGQFTYADIAMAVALQAVKPPAGFLHIGPATRAVWTDASLAARYADLLSWRDAIYEEHRGDAARVGNGSSR